MHTKTEQVYFLAVLTILALVLAFFIFRPFLIVLVLAAVFAVVLQPLYRAFLRGLERSPGFAAFMTMVVAGICILGPLAFLSVHVFVDAERLYATLTADGGMLTDRF